ncbi:hypothetical protein EG329_012008 [Mollisiaceae sp. DMI_Dod_QoI]|nr:hypothetical protein EG329_012008 [Helotiales sp. DMI_Dod_QoI]
MSLIERLSSLMKSRPVIDGRSNGQISALAQSPLGNLPVDVLIYLVEFMPPSTAICFALTCKPIWFSVSHQLDLRRFLGLSVPQKSADAAERLVLWTALRRDPPTLQFCTIRKLRSKAKRIRHEELRDGRPIVHNKCLCKTRLNLKHYVPRDFDWGTFRTIMILHKHKYDVSNLLSQLFRGDTVRRVEYTYQWATTAKIVKKRLILRIQEWYLVPKHRAINIPPRRTAYVSPHYYGYYKQENSPIIFLGHKLADHAKHRISGASGDRCEICSEENQCQSCNTECQIDIKDFGAQGTALVLSRWQNLGTIEFPSEVWDTCDELWHVSRSRPRPTIFKPGSIKASYEKDEVDDFLEPKDERLFVSNTQLLLM